MLLSHLTVALVALLLDPGAEITANQRIGNIDDELLDLGLQKMALTWRGSKCISRSSGRYSFMDGLVV